MTKGPVKRCAIYTRKSSEEGLEQDFNSLQAQRESCEAFIKSQQSEGWRLIPTAYNDGGISGATMERVALQKLLADIGAGQVDVIVVYKVDRLTRSLADFAKMVELFDSKCVSFVAVTQQFNTTSSMGRLTLNVLLSFAQFEREVTGERIRDKIAASKRKGMWMGGNVPLGYDIKDRKLIINPKDAKLVQDIFCRYHALGNVRVLKVELDQRGLRGKPQIKNGSSVPGAAFSRGWVYKILSNRIYIGEIVHKEQSYPGQHEPIVDRALWDAVQSKLADKAVRTGPRKTASSPLMGKLFDESGRRLTPSHAVKDGRRYRYYTSESILNGHAKENRGWRLPALEIERAVAAGAVSLLRDRNAIDNALGETETSGGSLTGAIRSADRMAVGLASDQNGALLGTLINRVDLKPDSLKLTLNLPLEGGSIKLTGIVPLQMKRRGVELRMVVAGQPHAKSKSDPVLLKAIGRAHGWFDEILAGKSVPDIAREEGIYPRYIRNVLPLAFLAPSIVEAIVEGTQPLGLTTHRLIHLPELPADWSRQREMLGFTQEGTAGSRP